LATVVQTEPKPELEIRRLLLWLVLAAATASVSITGRAAAAALVATLAGTTLEALAFSPHLRPAGLAMLVQTLRFQRLVAVVALVLPLLDQLVVRAGFLTLMA
jgi:hypothetical protein